MSEFKKISKAKILDEHRLVKAYCFRILGEKATFSSPSMNVEQLLEQVGLAITENLIEHNPAQFFFKLGLTLAQEGWPLTLALEVIHAYPSALWQARQEIAMPVSEKIQSSGEMAEYWHIYEVITNITRWVTEAFIGQKEGFISELYRQLAQQVEEKDSKLLVQPTIPHLSDTNMGILTTDEKGRVTYLNPAMEKLIGRKLTQIAKKTLWEVIDFGEADTIRSRVNSVLKTGDMTLPEEQVILHSQDGKPFPVIYWIIPIIGESANHISGLQLLLRNMGPSTSEIARTNTPRRAEDEALQRYAKRLEILHEIGRGLIEATSIPDVIKATIANILQFIPCRLALVTLLEPLTNEIIVFNSDSAGEAVPGQHINFPPNLLEGFNPNHIRLTTDNGVFKTLHPKYTSEGLVSALEVLLVAKAGTIGILTLLADTSNFFTAEHQEIAKQISSQIASALKQLQLVDEMTRATAVLERNMVVLKQTDVALKKTKDQLQAILDYSPSNIYMKDLEGRFLLMNQRTAVDLNITPDAAIGKTEDELSPFRLREQRELQYQQVIEKGTPLSFEEQEGERTFLMTKFPILNCEHQVYAIGGISTDITPQKRHEKALEQALRKEKELNDLKTRFISVASHEFRTPLATILAATETLLIYRGQMDAEQIDKRLNKIKDQVGHLKLIMDDVLIQSKMQSGHMEFSPIKTDLDAFCRDILEEFTTSLGFSNQILYYASGQPLIVQFDPRLMRHILNNLLSNALKYSLDGKNIYFEISQQQEQFKIQVKDEGIGIPEKDLQHLYEPFHRSENIGTIAGTGLGLSIVKLAVEAHDGIIEVESQVGVGTTFTVIIPQL